VCFSLPVWWGAWLCVDRDGRGEAAA